MENLIKNTNNFIQQMRRSLTERSETLTDEQVRHRIEETILRDPDWEGRKVQELKKVVDRVFHALRSDLDILQPWMDDPTVSEIMVNGPDHIFLEREGKIEAAPDHFYRREDLEEVIRRLAARVHREINERHPIVDARMENGSRVNAVYRNIALGGPVLTIRKFPESGLTIDFAFLLTDPERSAALSAAAQAITPGVGELTTKLVLAEAWALAEAENDIRLLEHGRRVPLMKTGAHWQVDLDSIIKEKKQGYIDDDAAAGLTYDGYLQLFLFCLDREAKYGRMMDLIQLNIQGTRDGSFLVREHSLGFHVEAKINGRKYVYEQKY